MTSSSSWNISSMRCDSSLSPSSSSSSSSPSSPSLSLASSSLSGFMHMKGQCVCPNNSHHHHHYNNTRHHHHYHHQDNIPTVSPGPRTYASMVYAPQRREYILFGGWGMERMSDLWSFSWEHGWSRIHPCNAPCSPSSRDGHAAVAATGVSMPFGRRDVMMIHGGEDEHGVRDDLWALDLDTLHWHHISIPQLVNNDNNNTNTNNNSPARVFHTITLVHPNRLLLFGGFWETKQNDLWMLDLDRMQPVWMRIHDGSGIDSPVPSPRYFHAACTPPSSAGSSSSSRGHHMWIFGGLDSRGRINDLWCLDTSNDAFSWTCLRHHRHVTYADPSSTDPSHNYYDYNNSDNNNNDNDHNDLATDTIINGNATNPSTASLRSDRPCPVPLQRSGASLHAVHDPVRSKDILVLLGGFNADANLADVWVYDIDEDVWIPLPEISVSASSALNDGNRDHPHHNTPIYSNRCNTNHFNNNNNNNNNNNTSTSVSSFPPRYGHAACLEDSLPPRQIRIMVFGGFDMQDRADMWYLTADVVPSSYRSNVAAMFQQRSPASLPPLSPSSIIP